MKKLIFLLFLTLQVLCSNANNIQVTNVSVLPATNTVQFTVTWDNGWRSSILNNWDAAWVFFKYYDPITTQWQHLYFTGNGNVIPAGFTSELGKTGTDFVGYFLYRNAVGSGTTTIANIQLGIPAQQATGIYDIKVFAIEMVYVPQAEFYVGDVSSNGSFYNNISPSTLTPAFVHAPPNSTNAVIDGLTFATLSSLNASFPAGYNAFYCMKYELSQGAYRDFLNSLTYTQQSNHTIVTPNSAIGSGSLVSVSGTSRNSIEIKTSGNSLALPAVYGCDANNNNIFDEPGDGEWVPCNYLNWPDMAAYLTWAGLRPYTELEYEKACRGIQISLPGEYAWGNTFISNTPYARTNVNTSSESITNLSAVPFGNALYGFTANGNGIVRNGSFATATSNRITSGASFYGIMEMSGNLLECVFLAANASPYTGTHGNGFLNSNGYSTVGGNWPGFNTNPASLSIDGTIATNNLICRGGYEFGSANTCRVSDRSFNSTGVIPQAVTRNSYHGCRGARTAQ